MELGRDQREHYTNETRISGSLVTACYDADLILSTLAGSVWIGIRLADISSQNVSCEAQEAMLVRLRRLLSLVMWHEQTPDALGGVVGAGLS